jgi:glycosyltransferase involved in cell wall biosynthesis
MGRLYVDVTFTRAQPSPVGITRTVMRLYQEFERLAPAEGMVCVPVAFHTAGFRSVPHNWTESTAGAPLPGPLPWNERAMRWITEGPLRTLVSQHFPLPLRRLAWLAYAWWEFDRLARDLPATQFAPGDVLFLADASWNYPVWSAAVRARRAGAQVVTMVHDLIPVRQPEFTAPLTTIAFRKWVRRMMPCSDGVLCNSNATETELHQYAAEFGISLPRTADFRLGCDPAPAVTSPDHVRPEIREFLTGIPCFTAIGSIEPRKNYAFVLDVFEQLWRRGLEARLLIIGRRTPQCRDLLERMARHSELGRRLLIVYDGSDEEVACAYARSRALLFPSLAEGFGLPLVEARARGCAVIASDLPAFAELADEGVSLFPLGSVDVFAELVVSHLQRPPSLQPVVPFRWADSARSCFAFMQAGLRAAEDGVRRSFSGPGTSPDR